MSFDFFGYVSAGLFITCYIPQIVRTWRIKSVDDLSIWTWVCILFAHLFGVSYAVGIHAFPLLLNHMVGMSLSSIIILQWFLHKDHRKDIIRKTVNDFLKQSRRRFKK